MATSDNRPDETVVAWRICRATLPDYGVRVLVSYASKNSNWKGVQIAFRSSTDKSGEHWKDHGEANIADGIEVYAWVPLPKPSIES